MGRPFGSGVRPLAERFWEKVDKLGADECWPWTKCKHPTGYGQFNITARKPMRASRVALCLASGVDPLKADPAIVAMHSCDNRICCNPAHLSFGTQEQNWADMRARGRGSKPPRRVGEANNKSKLTAAIVRKIRAAPAGARLAAKYGVSYKTIQDVRERKTWAHVQ